MQLQTIQNKIYELPGQKVILDFDLSILYEVETRALNRAVKRNMDIFPEDFIFQITEKEWETMSSQFVMTYLFKRPKTSLPLAFTEYHMQFKDIYEALNYLVKQEKQKVLLSKRKRIGFRP